MGCASSKLVKKDLRQEAVVFGNGDCASNHVVSLTSSTYGVLRLDKDQQPPPVRAVAKETTKRSPPPLPREERPEVINAWEMMEGLEEEIPISVQPKRSPKSLLFLRGFADLDARSPLKFLNQVASPKKLKRFGGKENKGIVNRFNGTPQRASKEPNLVEISPKTTPNLRISKQGSVTDSGVLSRRSLSPLFDPELVAFYEKELSEKEEEQIKKMVSATPFSGKSRNSRDSDSTLASYDQKCPPGGENAVVIYTTTLRGIRKTFEDCNNVRSIIESHCVRTMERDVSMDSGFREEVRGLMGTKAVKVPLVFVKGRLIGGADEVAKLEEEGKLGILLGGVPKAAAAGCDGCGGIRFVMCVECNGSRKLLDENGKKTVCGECNENGLIHCPICC